MDAEFVIIQRYFSAYQQRTGAAGDDAIVLGIGDDCALLRPPADELLAVSLDLLVAGTHFFADADPVGVGHKALAVNLSDLAAAGARPAWVTLGLTLPATLDESWVAGFCRGFFALAERHNVRLIGGDTTTGPLAIAVQAHGLVKPHQALRRSGASPGDSVFVTGTVGDAALGLRAIRHGPAVAKGVRDALRERLERPTPRVAQGLDLAGLASAAIDVSDGLTQDLGHILTASKVGARLWPDRLPRSAAAAAWPDQDQVLAAMLGGGDDYELCFTVAPARHAELLARAARWGCGYTKIGVIEAEPGLRGERTEDGSRVSYAMEQTGYEHFITTDSAS